MKDVEFLSYIETPEEKYLGVASVLLANLVILRYKIQSPKEGTGFFISPPSFKDAANDRWLEWHCIDSRSQNEKIVQLIRERVNEFMITAKRPIENKQESAAWGPPSEMAF